MASKEIRRLAAQQRPEPRLRLRQGVVDAVNGDGTVDVYLGADDVLIASVATLTTVAASDTVFMLQTGGDLLVLGTPN